MVSLHRLPLMLCIAVVASLPMIGSGPAVPAATAEQDLSTAVVAKVDRTIEGDSLDVHIDGRRVAVGYEDVETPDPGQPCGRDALERNRQLVGDRILLVENPNAQFDAMGRRLFRAYSADGGSIAETLVREGLGRAVRGVPDADRLVALEDDARAAGLGCLWG